MLITLSHSTAICQSVDQCASLGSCESQMSISRFSFHLTCCCDPTEDAVADFLPLAAEEPLVPHQGATPTVDGTVAEAGIGLLTIKDGRCDG